MSTFLGNLASGEYVADRHKSYFHHSVTARLPELFSKIFADDRPFIIEEIDLGRIIGKSICVETNDQDEIVYAVRAKRGGFTRFVKNREGTPSSKAVVILQRNDETGSYTLITAFIGVNAPPEPWDKNATDQSSPFWSTHALIMDGTYEIIPGTERESCPW